METSVTDKAPSENTGSLDHAAQQVPAPNGFPLRMFFGHHKCATGWIDNILMEICFHMGINFHMAHLPSHFQPYGGLSGLVNKRKVDFLAYTNADADLLGDLQFFRGFHVVRDPRDILVSAYFSHLHSHSTKGWEILEGHRQKLQSSSKEEGLFAEMEFSEPGFNELFKWDYNQPNVLELRMEELTAYPLEIFMRIARFLEILDEDDQSYVEAVSSSLQYKMNRLNFKGRRYMPGNLPMFPVPRRRQHKVTPQLLEKILDIKSFKRMSGGRKKGQENVKNHFRKGVPGDWRNHLNADHIAAFKERYNPVLIKLGYEESEDWD